jgi:hypothetical protein
VLRNLDAVEQQHGNVFVGGAAGRVAVNVDSSNSAKASLALHLREAA